MSKNTSKNKTLNTTNKTAEAAVAAKPAKLPRPEKVPREKGAREKLFTVTFVKAADLDPNTSIKCLTVKVGDKSFTSPNKVACREWLKEEKKSIQKVPSINAAQKAIDTLKKLGIEIPAELLAMTAVNG